MLISVRPYLLVSAILFSLGILGFFVNRRHIINLLISIEIILLAVNINFIAFASGMCDLAGQVFSIFILTIAAAESAIGLAIIVIYFRRYNTIDIDYVTNLKD
jgi:NADH-quinone oxidoreductase subunit K